VRRLVAKERNNVYPRCDLQIVPARVCGGTGEESEMIFWRTILVEVGDLHDGDEFTQIGSTGSDYVVSHNGGGDRVFAYPTWDQDQDDPVWFFASEMVKIKVK